MGFAKLAKRDESWSCFELPRQRATAIGATEPRDRAGMLLSDLATVRAAKIVLASGSPRRVDMFNGLLKLNARVVPSTFPEDLDKSLYTPESCTPRRARTPDQQPGSQAGLLLTRLSLALDRRGRECEAKGARGALPADSRGAVRPRLG